MNKIGFCLFSRSQTGGDSAIQESRNGPRRNHEENWVQKKKKERARKRKKINTGLACKSFSRSFSIMQCKYCNASFSSWSIQTKQQRWSAINTRTQDHTHISISWLSQDLSVCVNFPKQPGCVLIALVSNSPRVKPILPSTPLQLLFKGSTPLIQASLEFTEASIAPSLPFCPPPPFRLRGPGAGVRAHFSACPYGPARTVSKG